ncbi:V-set and immunoglobulin domain-containing protein 1-like [Periophthalmus magnuspinnatus]|uniref:V-set and immunoglobulin domain-containing protein 1-like n=1 Tax=Periophthalmus magnuspinnatus TaxID=409849 RepID=UPI00145A2AF3|nr:V-set and immunoglobulin domain-containing protein 1-like [Periophthalmus magnuspinnatus]
MRHLRHLKEWRYLVNTFTSGPGNMLYFSVFFSLIGCVELITVTTLQKFVNVTSGGTVLLPCTFVTSAPPNSLTIQWDMVSKTSMTPQQLYYYQSGKDVITQRFEGRLQPPLSPATSNNASIILSNMQSADSGVYTCEVHNFPDVDGQSQASIVVNVLEKPSQPYCSVHGDVESGHLVTLTCHSERGSPPPIYTWIRLDQTKTRRPVLGRTTDTGILQIANISQFEFGEYQCNATNAVGYSTCTIELNPEVGAGVVAGAVIGALLLCLLIVLIVWFIAHTVKKSKYKTVKVSEASEMRGSHSQAVSAPATVETEITTSDQHHDEEDEAQA